MIININEPDYSAAIAHANYEQLLTSFEKIKAENAELRAQIEQLQKIAKEEAHDAYYEASDRNRCDSLSDTFDEDIRAEFEEYWSINKIYENFKIEPAQCLAEIKAQAVEEFIAEFKSSYPTYSIRKPFHDPIGMMERVADKLRQQGEQK